MPVTFSPLPRFPPQENEHGGERMGRRRSPKEVPFLGEPLSLVRRRRVCIKARPSLPPSHKTEKEKKRIFLLSLSPWLGGKECFEHISCAYGHLGDFHGLCVGRRRRRMGRLAGCTISHPSRSLLLLLPRCTLLDWTKGKEKT